MNVVLPDVLLDERDLSVGVPVAVDGKVADLVSSITFNLIIEDVQVVNLHFMILAILLVHALPDLVGAGHLEGTAELLEGPGAGNFFPVELTIIEDLVLAQILLLEVSEAVGLNVALESELTDIVMALASHDLTGTRLKAQPGHLVSLTILLVVADPHGVALELIWLGHEIVGRGDAHRVRHLVPHHWHVHYGSLHAHHHLRLLHHHLGLLHHHLGLLHHHLGLLLHHLGLRLWLLASCGVYF